MKLISFRDDDNKRLGLLIGDQVYPVGRLQPGFPETMQELLEGWDRWIERLWSFEKKLRNHVIPKPSNLALGDIELCAPVPNPGSCRDGYAFRQHVEAARRNRGADMTRVFDEFPVFYFTNHRTVQGPGVVHCMPDHLGRLDFELEAAFVICREGKNIKAADADRHIGGLMVMNDLSARDLQMEEMLLNLGPAKGKDFATVLGPWLVTLDELQEMACPPKAGHTGLSWKLSMYARVNGVTVSRGNLSDMDWTFAEIIERASYGVTLYPGVVIGSGTVGTGCFLELNGTAKMHDSFHVEQWLKAADHIELEIEGLGILSSTIAMENTRHSLLELKKS